MKFKKIVAALLVLSIALGIASNAKVGSATTISRAFSVTDTQLVKVTIHNENDNNAVTVSYSAVPDGYSDVVRVGIYETSQTTGTPLTSSTFTKANPHTATFKLPARATYYALISPVSYTGGSLSGQFKATY